MKVPYYEEQNKIIFTDDMDLHMSQGHLFVNVLMKIANTPNVNSEIKSDWLIIKKYLNYESGPFTSEQKNKIGKAWISYLARGIAPSIELEKNFKEYAIQANIQKWTTIKIPENLIFVFDRMLTTKGKIETKRHNPIQKTLNNSIAFAPYTKDRLTQFIGDLSKEKRLIVSVLIFWIAYVLLRTDSDHEILGQYLERWDDDYLLTNILVPPAIVTVMYFVGKWIKNGR